MTARPCSRWIRPSGQLSAQSPQPIHTPSTGFSGFRIVLGGTGDHLGPFIGHNDRQFLGADVDAGGAAHALVRVHLGGALDDFQGIKPAGLDAVPKPGTAVVAVVGQVQLDRFPTGGGPGLA